MLVRHFNDMYDQHSVLKYGPPKTSVHLHGNASLPQHDGYASDTTSCGQYKDYWYPAFQDARTLWYHDHGVHHTGANAYMGLSGQYHLHDDVERASGMPIVGSTDGYGNPHDVPFLLRDAAFDSNGQLLFNDHDHDSAFGDVILVNGVPWPTMTVEPRQYRFRVLNAAVSRSFELALSVRGSKAALPMLVVATDGGLMEFAVPTTALLIGPAERYEIIIDFTAHAGRTLLLKNVAPRNNIDYARTGEVMQFQVGHTVTDGQRNATTAGQRLRPAAAHCMSLVATGAPVRTMQFRRAKGQWTINGKTWADVVKSGYKATQAEPKLDAVEVWKLSNAGSGGWFHPVHMHLVDFKILSRVSTRKERNRVFDYEKGPKDVVYVGEHETVTVVARYGPQRGRYMIHCHNLVHEDHDMMHQLWIKAETGSDRDGYDPMGSRAADHAPSGALHLPAIPGGAPQFPPAYP